MLNMLNIPMVNGPSHMLLFLFYPRFCTQLHGDSRLYEQGIGLIHI